MFKELCQGQYWASQVDEKVNLFAIGVHPTSGYKAYFEPFRMPHTYGLYHEKPVGNVLMMVTPFTATIQYQSKQAIESVTIIDASGKHAVKVEHISEESLLHAVRGGGDMPGPSLEAEAEAAADVDARRVVIHRWEGRGYSDAFQFDEALKNAIANLQITELPYPDALLEVQVTSIGAEVGGFAGLNRLVVTVVASVR